MSDHFKREGMKATGEGIRILIYTIQLVHSKGDQPWVFFGRTDAKAETLVLWPLYAMS